MKKHLLRVLGISNAEIAREAKITRQAITTGSPRVDLAAFTLIKQRESDPIACATVREALTELKAFLPRHAEEIGHEYKE